MITRKLLMCLSALALLAIPACGGGGGSGPGIIPILPPPVVDPDPQKPPVEIAIFGDSLTAGGVNRDGIEGFPVQQITQMSQGRIQGIDFAYGGTTTRAAIAGEVPPLAGIGIEKAIRDTKAPIVVLRYGGADTVFGTDVQVVRRDTEKMIQWGLDAGKQVVLVGKIMIPPNKEVSDDFQMRYFQMHFMLQDLANRWGLEFIDISGVIGKDYEMYDAVHPDVEYMSRHSAEITRQLIAILDKPEANKPKPYDPLSKLKTSKRILMFTAHPDDETLFSQSMAQMCKDAECMVHVATPGGGHGAICLRGLCESRSLEDVRAEELERVSKALNFKYEIHNFNLGQQRVSGTFNEEIASPGSLTQWVRTKVLDFNPDVIVTFDPRSGFTCHDEHILVGRIVTNALWKWFDHDRVFLNTGKLTFDLSESSIGGGFGVATNQDITNYIYDGKRQWDHVITNLKTHASQFTDNQVRSMSLANDDNKSFSWQRLSDYDPSDVRYKFCGQ